MQKYIKIIYMNIIKIKGIIYKLESVWRKNKKDAKVDLNSKIFPWPINRDTSWQNQENFLDKLKEIETHLLKHRMYKKYTKNYNCKFNDKKNVTNKLFILNNICWENGLYHYIEKHNVKPSNIFIDFIFSFAIPKKIKSKIIKRINGKKIIRYDKQFLKISKNQILILDALMEHGSNKKYVDKYKDGSFKYSEHSGLLDFNKFGLEKIVVSANTTRIDKGDDDIYLPQNMPDALDYEFIFHTHPPTPKPGSRAKVGILYEFPSISDIYHFIDHHNDGNTQGSIIIAPEGIYIIRKYKFNNKKIHINENKLYDEFDDELYEAQHDAIDKYGTKFSKELFYEKIAQDRHYIDIMNKVINKYDLHIDYFPRIKDKNNKWVVDTLYLPIYVVE
jgi:hypothetical protein